MALAGRKPKPNDLHLVDGTYRPHRHTSKNDGVEASGTPVKPKLKGAASRIWDRSILRFPWLAEADSDKLAMYCALQAEFEKDPKAMTAARIGHLRNLGSELGGDPISRTRMQRRAPTNGKKEDKYF